MNGINEVAKHNDKWRALALKLCKDYDLAQDLVQNMYINLMDKEYINDALVAITIKNLWLGTFRASKNTIAIDSPAFKIELENKQSLFEVEDDQLGYLERFNELPYRQQELILESFDFSVRQIADRFNINRTYVHRQIHKGLAYVLENNYKQYSNSNLKYLKLTNEVIENNEDELMTEEEFSNWVNKVFDEVLMTDKEFSDWINKVTSKDVNGK